MTTLAQRNFSGGEIAPAFHGRMDVARVQAGLAACRNWLVERSGALANRAGTEHRGTVRAVGSAWRLVASVRDLDTTYVLELGHRYARVWRGSAPVDASSAPGWTAAAWWRPGSIVNHGGALWWAVDENWNAAGITLALSGGGPAYTLTASAPALAGLDGQVIALHDPQGNVAVCLQSAHASATVSTVTIIQTVLVDPSAPAGSLPASFDPAKSAAPTALWSTPYTPSPSGPASAYWYPLSAAVVEFPTPWADVDLRALNVAQSVDVVTVCDPAYPPMQIRRYGDLVWQLAPVATATGITANGALPTPSAGFLQAPTGGAAVRANPTGGPFSYQYQYQVTAVDAGGNESDPCAVFACYNAPPYLTGAGGYGNLLSWDAVPSAVSYNIYRQTAAGSDIYGFVASVDNQPAAALIPAPAGLTATGGNPALPASRYLVSAWTAAGQSAGQAVPATASVGGVDGAHAVTVAWSAVAGAYAYYVYRYDDSVGAATSGLFVLIATVTATTVSDTALALVAGTYLMPGPGAGRMATLDAIVNPDPAVHPGVPGSAPLTARRPELFASPGNYPAVACYFQQRYVFAQTALQPECVWMSQAGNYGSFASSFPSKPSDAVIVQVNGYRVNPIRHLVDLGALLLFTDNGVYSVQGGATGVAPGAIAVHQENYVGCQGGAANLAPVVYDNTAIYVQARGNIVRSIRFDLYTNGYRGDNQSLYAQHLLDGYGIAAWAWAEVPLSTLWLARSDGVLLAMTFIPEQQITGWSRHVVAGGLVEDVCVVPEAVGASQQDTLYLLVRRTISGSVVRTLERLAPRQGADPVDAFFVDGGTRFDGRDTTGATVALSGGSAWDPTETLTLTASAPTAAFALGNGTVFVLHAADGSLVRFTQAAAVSSTVLTGTVDAVVPASLRGAAAVAWSRAWTAVVAPQLAGRAVAVLADGAVVSPDLDAGTTLMADADGRIALPAPAEIVVAGWPIAAEFTTLDIETGQPAQSLSERPRLVRRIVLRVDATAGIQAGPADGEIADPAAPVAYDAGAALFTGCLDLEPGGAWNRSGAITVRQARPLPARVLSIAASVGFAPVAEGGLDTGAEG
jgi:hypothetical protein